MRLGQSVLFNRRYAWDCVCAWYSVCMSMCVCVCVCVGGGGCVFICWWPEGEGLQHLKTSLLSLKSGPFSRLFLKCVSISGARCHTYTEGGCLQPQYKSFYFIFQDTGQVHRRGKRDVSLVSGFTA